MPAPNIADIMDWESHYEGALKNYFQNIQIANVNVFAQVLTPKTIANISLGTTPVQTPRLQIKMSASRSLLEETTGPNNNGAYYLSDKEAVIAIDVCSQRNADPTQHHGLLRGLTRQGMLEMSAVLNANTLPYYQTLDVIETGSTQGIDAENEEIITSINYSVRFFIIPTQFPAN